MRKPKLNREDLTELRKRQEQINQYYLVVQSLMMTKNAWLAQKFPVYGLDKAKQYNIDFKSGKISEVIAKDEPKGPEKVSK